MKIYESNMKLILTVLAGITAFIAVYFCIGQNIAQVLVDKQMEDAMNLSYFKEFSLKLVSGEGEITEDIYKGHKVTVFNGWGPWCAPCVNEMPDLDELSREYADKGLQVIGVVADYYLTVGDDDSSDYDAEIYAVLDKLKVSYPNVLADEAFSNQVLPTMNNAFPCTWAVNENGDVIGIMSGSNEADVWRDQFDEWLAQADNGTEGSNE